MSRFAKEQNQLTRLRDRTDFSAHLMIWTLAAAHIILAIAAHAKAPSLALGAAQETTLSIPSSVLTSQHPNQIFPGIYN
ncbi:MAG: hypothetical protein QNJ46_09445 [Leptolyngbyaceae cyanobacterium MO_188.B28]|nr:hypothetical protein [Leptolyngbyaceae cyanobacterium MO_188.B28]